MKKSKILMPLTGIAAVGAFAPVVAMSACHKNEYNLIKEAQVGLYVGDATKTLSAGATVAQTLGTETVASAAAFSSANLVCHVKFGMTIEKGHVIKVSGKHQGSHTKDGGLFYTEDMDEDEIVQSSIAGETEMVFDFSGVVKYNELKEITAETKEEFSFTLTYSEYDSAKQDAKLIGKQSYTYTIKADNSKHDLPYIHEGTVAGSVGVNKDTVQLSGWTIPSLVEEKDVKVSFADKTGKIELKDSNTPATAKTLTISCDQNEETISKAKPSLEFVGKLDKVFETVPETMPTFKDFDAAATPIEVTMKLTGSADYYTQGTWNCVVTIDAKTGIQVTVVN